MKKKVAVLPGDGVGPEVTASAVSVIQTVTDKIEFLNGNVGLKCRQDTGEYLPRKTIDVIDESDAVLFGNVADPTDDPAYRSPLLVMAKQLDLYLQLKRFYRLSNDPGTKDINCLLVTENKEAALMTEMENLDGVTSTRHTSIVGSKKLCTAGRHIAEINNIKSIMLAHDGDHMRMSKNILAKEFTEAMNGSPINSQVSSYIEVVRRLVTEPEKFELIVATGLRGELVDSIMTTISGRGMTTPTGCLGDTKGIFRPDHGPMENIVGQNRANPTAAILAGGMLLDFLGLRSEGKKIREAVSTAYKRGCRAEQIGTYEFTERVVSICGNHS